MSTTKDWVMQMRYPYTAGVIAIMWVGTAALAIICDDISAQVLVALVAAATLIIAASGFSSK